MNRKILLRQIEVIFFKNAIYYLQNFCNFLRYLLSLNHYFKYHIDKYSYIEIYESKRYTRTTEAQLSKITWNQNPSTPKNTKMCHEMASLSNSRWQNRKERQNWPTNNVNMAERAKRPVSESVTSILLERSLASKHILKFTYERFIILKSCYAF